MTTDRIPLRALVDLPRAVAEASNNASTMADVLPVVLRIVGTALDWEFGHAYLHDPVTQRLSSSGAFHVGDAGVEAFRAASDSTCFGPGEGLPGRVHATNAPAWIVDVLEDANFTRREAALRAGLRSAFATPVRVGERAVAVLEFATTRNVARDARLLSVMDTVGTQIGRVYEREEARRALLEANEQLLQANETKSTFISIVSHELRTPLVAMAGLNGILQLDWRQLPEEEVDDLLASVGRQATRLQRLVADLLTTTSLQAGNVTASPRPVPLAAKINQSVVDLLMTADVHVQCPGDIRVLVDPDHLTQIVTNLLANARRYGEPPIRITTRIEDGLVAFDVRDHGSGVDPDFTDALFERFTQGPGHVATTDGATGLGLAIVDGLVRANGGSVTYVSADDGPGATFRVTLPRAD